jgi:hypothetical protein
VTQLRDAYWSGQAPKLVAPRVDQPDTVGKTVLRHVGGNTRQHGLATVCEIAYPRCLVDCRARVIVFVSQLHITGVHADAQPDGCQVCPLQIQCTRDRVSRLRERRHETVTFALLERAHAAVLRDELVDGAVEMRKRGRHHVRLGLP